MKKETPFYLRHFRHIAVLLFLSLFSFLSGLNTSANINKTIVIRIIETYFKIFFTIF